MLIAGLPQRPSDYASLPGAWVPRPRTRKLIGMLGVILSAIAVIMLGYLAVGLAGYLAYPGRQVSSNVLNSFPDDTLMLVRVRCRATWRRWGCAGPVGLAKQTLAAVHGCVNACPTSG